MDNDRLEDLARELDHTAFTEPEPTRSAMSAKAAQAIRSLLADSAAKDVELAKLNELLATGANGRTLAAEAALAEARRVIDHYKRGLQILASTFYKEDQHQDYASHILNSAPAMTDHTFLQENPS